MKIQNRYFKKVISSYFVCTAVFAVCTTLVACSVKSKPNLVDTSSRIETINTENNLPIIINSRDIPPQQNISLDAKRPLLAGTLDAHNRVRAKHGIPPLTWSDKLANYSQQWANHLGAGQSCKMYHRSGSPPYGENLYMSSAIIWTKNNTETAREKNRITVQDVIKAWADEEQWYNYKSNSCKPGQQCGHYTQIVWRDTTEVACAVKFCGDQSQTWVCSYNPPGNYTGQRPY